MHQHPKTDHQLRSASHGWCPEEDTRDSIVARRNVLAALWAGRLQGLSGPALTAYAVEVHLADFQAPGDSDVLDKIIADLHRAGLPARPSDIRARLNAFHRQALAQTRVTD